MVIAIGKKDDCGHVNRAMVCDLTCPDYGIMCQRNEYGNWEAVYFLYEAEMGPMIIGVMKPIPPGYPLEPDALDALENVWILDAESGEVV